MIAIDPEPPRRQNAYSPSPPRGAAWEKKESGAASMRAPVGLGLWLFLSMLRRSFCEIPGVGKKMSLFPENNKKTSIMAWLDPERNRYSRCL